MESLKVFINVRIAVADLLWDKELCLKAPTFHWKNGSMLFICSCHIKEASVVVNWHVILMWHRKLHVHAASYSLQCKDDDANFNDMTQVDETYIGGKTKRNRGGQGRSTKQKTPVMGLLRDGLVYDKS